MRIRVYSRPGCHLCEEVLRILDRVTPQYGLQVDEINIFEDAELYNAYKELIPVVEAGDDRDRRLGRLGRLVAPIDEAELRVYLEIARRTLPVDIVALPPEREPLMDRLATYVGGHWPRLVSIALALFVGLPWLAPVFAALGWWNLADPIYTAYAIT
ncbi:MAG: glutaredoxin family protein [Chloroflexia bacterium]